MTVFYAKFTLNDFLSSFCVESSACSLFELTPTWLEATAKYMCTEHEQVLIHCLMASSTSRPEQVLIAWPLIHQTTLTKQTIRSLTSFYSAVTAPFEVVASALVTNLEEHSVSQVDVDRDHGCGTSSEGDFTTLLAEIKKNNPWQQMLLGPVEDEFSQQILASCKYAKVYARADNWYIDSIENFQYYYEQRPSQLKNTVKRKTKKLTKEHSYHVEIITEVAAFEDYFTDYQAIYHLSWKGEETSFEFIKQVGTKAAAENKLRMGILFVNNKAVAVQLWFLQGNSASIFKLAYDPAYKVYSVGSILSMALSEHVIALDKVSRIEFGMGSEPYKQDWMEKRRQRATLQIFNERSFVGVCQVVRHLVLPKIKKLILPSSEG